jgi:hypothetical protein
MEAALAPNRCLKALNRHVDIYPDARAPAAAIVAIDRS